MQVAHACLDAGAQFGAPPGHNVVVCGVEDENTLVALVNRARAAGVPMTLFHEPDDGVGFSAACSAPLTGKERAVFRQCSLLQ